MVYCFAKGMPSFWDVRDGGAFFLFFLTEVFGGMKALAASYPVWCFAVDSEMAPVICQRLVFYEKDRNLSYSRRPEAAIFSLCDSIIINE